MSLRDWAKCVEPDLPVHLRTLCTCTDICPSTTTVLINISSNFHSCAEGGMNSPGCRRFFCRRLHNDPIPVGPAKKFSISNFFLAHFFRFVCFYIARFPQKWHSEIVSFLLFRGPSTVFCFVFIFIFCQKSQTKKQNFNRKRTKNKEAEDDAESCKHVCMYVCMVIHIAIVWINRVRLPTLLVVS